MKSRLIQQTWLILVMASAFAAFMGCSGSSDKRSSMDFPVPLPGLESLSGTTTEMSTGEGIVSQTFKPGGATRGYLTSTIPWRNDEGGLEFYVEVSPHPDSSVTPDGFFVSRYLETSYRHGTFEGFSQSYRPLINHGLGDTWQGVSATNTYSNGGQFTVNYYTDIEDSDASAPPWNNDVFSQLDARHDIILHDIPPRPASYDWRLVWPTEEGLAGSLDGVEGRFMCLARCSLGNERLPPDWDGYLPGYNPKNHVIFVPADGSQPIPLSGSASQEIPQADYLSLGYWLYTPGDETDPAALEGGVFASGRDAFVAENLMPMTGTATYTGKALGIYAAANPVPGSFNADVELTADFGTTGEFGTMSGLVSNVVLDSGAPSPLTELRLETSEIGLPTQFIDTDFESPSAGGWVEGSTGADGGWNGAWGGRFFGNGDATDHPSSFAGTFGATDGTHTFSGGFGAYRNQ